MSQKGGVARTVSLSGMDRIALISGGRAGGPLPFQPFVECDWPSPKAILWHNWDFDESTLESLRKCAGVVLKGFSLAGLDSLFRLRALQLLRGEPCLDIPSIAIISQSDIGDIPAPGLRRRVSASWPFRSLLCIADGAAGDWLKAEGFPVIGIAEAEKSTLEDLLQHAAAVASRAGADQEIGVQIQPMWTRCGSSTAFANEIDCLLDRNLFTIRIYIDHERWFGETTLRYVNRVLPQNLLDVGPCLESIACAPPWRDGIADGKTGRRPKKIPKWPKASLAALFSWLGQARLVRNEYAVFAETIKKRTFCRIQDDHVATLVARASTVIVNHAINVGFAARVCPRARVVLDTHDYFTRGALERVRSGGDRKAFPDWGRLRRHAELESRLWKVADVCTTVSASEAIRIRRHAARCLLVLPNPYVKPWREPGESADWDVLVVADNHFFNAEAVAWFLNEVVVSDSTLSSSRIAIVGKVRESLEARWARRVPNVKWLGFVRDLDGLRLKSKITVCPDQAGTGISVKFLTAMAAGQPVVATSAAMRGLPQSVIHSMPVFDSGQAMAEDIRLLLSDPAKRVVRREQVVHAYAALQRSASFEAALACAEERHDSTEAARRWLANEIGLGAGTQRKVADRTPWFLSPKSLHIELGDGGNAAQYLSTGWHQPEQWGRFMDGRCASLCLPAALFGNRTMIEVNFLDTERSTNVAISCQGKPLSPAGLSTRDRSVRFSIDRAPTDFPDGLLTIDLEAESTFCQRDHDGGPDERVLGAGVMSVKITPGFFHTRQQHLGSNRA